MSEKIQITARRPTREMAGADDKLMVTPVGLRFPASLPYGDWERAGRKLAAFADSSSWCLGDWIVYGEHQYSGRYRVAAEAAGLDYQTLRNYAWVCRRFEPARRRASLSFQHHAEVASSPPEEQDRWLDLAERYGWSRNKLRSNMRGPRAQAVTGGRTTTSAIPGIQVARERVQRWLAAAEESGRSLEHWITESLDRAAEDALRADSYARTDGG